MKKPKLSTVKKKLWTVFSKYIRTKFADDNGYVSCVTCGSTKPIAEMQAGHFIPKAQGNAIYFEEENVNPQCYRCNINLGGNGAEYYPYMVEMYGEEKVDELRALSRTTKKFTVDELQDMEKEFKEKLNQLEKMRGAGL